MEIIRRELMAQAEIADDVEGVPEAARREAARVIRRLLEKHWRNPEIRPLAGRSWAIGDIVAELREADELSYAE